ncbi:response regulator [Candidatus Woesebacteria bacterium]|nr:response regulator [Candidatus Woesebacteria bacterium]
MAKRILIVEDEPYLRNLYFQLLTDEAYSVEQASDGDEAYEKMHQGGFDLVLLDIMLPHINGLEIMKKLTENPPLKPNKSIVALTNLPSDKLQKEIQSYGAKGYFIKSDYDPNQLLTQIKSFLK